MNKMNMINKLRKSLIFLVVLALIATVVIILIKIFWDTSSYKIYQSPYTARSWEQYDCLKLGNVCSHEDVLKAIKVKLPVNEKETYNFYVIDNDETTATLLMDSNLGGIEDWSMADTNQRGPISAFGEVLKRTENWTFIPIIESYEYLDFGKEYFLDICKEENKDSRDSTYDCSADRLRGYNGISIQNGKAIIKINEEDYSENNGDMYQTLLVADRARTRLITFEEYQNLRMPSGYPDWLIDNTTENEGYWTLSSSTFESTLYSTSALAVTNYLNKPLIRELYLVNQSNGLNKRNGLRPVITIDKY